MAWSAKVTNKEVRVGLYYVTLEFTDGVSVINETFRSPRPTPEWIPETVKSRLAQLDTVSTFDVPVGTVIPASNPVPVDVNISLFRRRVELLGTVKVLIDLGVILPTNPKVVALTDWIRNNLNTYFDTL